MLKEVDDNEKNKIEFKRVFLNYFIVEGIYRDSIRFYVFGIIEWVCVKV